MMNIIREYRNEDAQQVERCLIELQDYERQIDSHLIDGKTIAKKYLEHMFSRCLETNGKVFVVDVDNSVVGFVSIWAKVKSRAIEEQQYEYAYISDLVVLADYRGRGLGRALLQKAEDYAVLQGARLLRIAVLAKNHTAKELYHNFGFQDRLIELSKSLG
ncbi:MAG: GNAT family N-acetyltransferase [Acidobacteriota bacterium]